MPSFLICRRWAIVNRNNYNSLANVIAGDANRNYQCCYQTKNP